MLINFCMFKSCLNCSGYGNLVIALNSHINHGCHIELNFYVGFGIKCCAMADVLCMPRASVLDDFGQFLSHPCTCHVALDRIYAAILFGLGLFVHMRCFV